jgi:hypothetical protein
MSYPLRGLFMRASQAQVYPAQVGTSSTSASTSCGPAARARVDVAHLSDAAAHTSHTPDTGHHQLAGQKPKHPSQARHRTHQSPQGRRLEHSCNRPPFGQCCAGGSRQEDTLTNEAPSMSKAPGVTQQTLVQHPAQPASLQQHSCHPWVHTLQADMTTQPARRH